MSRILFITNRNILNTCGELRLIKNRAEAIYNSKGIATDFISFTHKEQVKPERIEAGGTLEILRHKLIPISYSSAYMKLKSAIKKKMQDTEYDVVIVSGALMLGLVDYIRSLHNKVRIIADMHGACEELIEFPGRNHIITFARKIYYKIDKHMEGEYLRKYDDILAVSRGLESYLVEEYTIRKECIHIVPCATSTEKIDRSKLIDIRNKARNKYNIDDSELLFIYSGGVSKWQCIDETVCLFNRILKELPFSKLLILSGDRSSIEKYKSDKILVDSLGASEVQNVLPAGDYAFLLRDDCVTNFVAYPNKFLEYVRSGMRIISTPFVKEVHDEINEYQLGYILKTCSYEDGLLKYCSLTHSFMDDVDRRQALIDDVCFEKRMNFINE